MLHMCKQMYRMLRTLRLHGGCNNYFFLNMKNQNVCWTNQITTHNKFIWVLEKNSKQCSGHRPHYNEGTLTNVLSDKIKLNINVVGI